MAWWDPRTWGKAPNNPVQLAAGQQRRDDQEGRAEWVTDVALINQKARDPFRDTSNAPLDAPPAVGARNMLGIPADPESDGALNP